MLQKSHAIESFEQMEHWVATVDLMELKERSVYYMMKAFYDIKSQAVGSE